MEIYGTIRNSGGTWSVISDSEHEPKNVTSVTVVNGSSSSGWVEVGFPLSTKVGTFLVVPDETCARAGIIAGASVGMDKAVIYFSQNGSPISPNSISNTNANFWFYGVMKVASEPTPPETVTCPTCGGSGHVPA